MTAWRVTAYCWRRRDSMNEWRKFELTRTIVTARDDPSMVTRLFEESYNEGVKPQNNDPLSYATRYVERILSIERLGRGVVEGQS